MMRPLRSAALTLLFALGQPAVIAFAQNQAENVAAARALGIQGVQLAEQGKCADAIEKLERAEALHHAPTILARLGECQVQTGHIVLGTENLNRVVREPLAPGAPQAFRDAQLRAQKVLDQALPRIAHLTVHVQPAGLEAQVTVGGTQVPAALLGAERPTDPGTHEIVASAPGHLQASTSVTLSEGARQEVTLTLTPDPSAVKPAAPAESTLTSPEPAAPVPPPNVAAPHKSNTLAYVLLGVGGAGIATGSVTGLMAVGKKKSLDCVDKRCDSSQKDDLDSAKTLALVSTIGFGVGIAGVAAGTVLLLTGNSGPAEAHVGSVRAQPYVGANSIGLVGSF